MRLDRRVRLVCLATAVLAMFVVPAMQAGSTPAAEGKVRFQLRGETSGPNVAGRFILSGALSDRGKLVGHTELGGGDRTLYGAKGRIGITVRFRPGSHARLTTWRIINGTRAYAGLRGRGTESGIYGTPFGPSSMRITMTGTVWRSNG
jgi:hypothetical protein